MSCQEIKHKDPRLMEPSALAITYSLFLLQGLHACLMYESEFMKKTLLKSKIYMTCEFCLKYACQKGSQLPICYPPLCYAESFQIGLILWKRDLIVRRISMAMSDFQNTKQCHLSCLDNCWKT